MSLVLAWLACGLAVHSNPQKPIRLEAESGTLHGVTLDNHRSGFSGTGYVTGFKNAGDGVVLRFPATAGIYDVLIRYSSPSGPKGYGIKVNGKEISGMFAQTGNEFAMARTGKIEIKNGVNQIEIVKGWGYYDVDYLELRPGAIKTKMRIPPDKLIDSQADLPTRRLFKKLLTTYGSKTLSGQYDLGDTTYISQVTGKLPAIFGADLIDYSPSRVAFNPAPKDATEKAIQRARLGQIITVSWHWNAPTDLINRKLIDKQGKEVDASWYKGFYTNATTFDLAKALEDTHSERYRLLIRDIDTIALQLKKYSKAGVPILWRPLHEAEGGWFWWGAKGPKPFVALWRLMFDRLTNFHKLHNLIWVFTTGENPAWYPGDAYVDILGVDAYPTDASDPLSSTWEGLLSKFDGKKLLAISEFGGVPDVPKMRKFGIRWSYFVSWPGKIKAPATSPVDLTRIYTNSAVVNKE